MYDWLNINQLYIKGLYNPMRKKLLTQSELSKLSFDQQWAYMFDATPHPDAKINDSRTPKGLIKGDVVYIKADIQFCGEKPLPEGTTLPFTRYGYSTFISYSMPIYEYAFFRFPDGSERSLQKDSFTMSAVVTMQKVIESIRNSANNFLTEKLAKLLASLKGA